MIMQAQEYRRMNEAGGCDRKRKVGMRRRHESCVLVMPGPWEHGIWDGSKPDGKS